MRHVPEVASVLVTKTQSTHTITRRRYFKACGEQEMEITLGLSFFSSSPMLLLSHSDALWLKFLEQCLSYTLLMPLELTEAAFWGYFFVMKTKLQCEAKRPNTKGLSKSHLLTLGLFSTWTQPLSAPPDHTTTCSQTLNFQIL